MSNMTKEQLEAIAQAAYSKSERPSSQFYKEEICYIVQKHVDAGIAVNSFREFYEACAATLLKEYGATLSPSTIQKQYAAWRDETGVDEVAYVNSRIEAQRQNFKTGEMKEAIGEVKEQEAKPGFSAQLETRPRQDGQK